MNFRLTTVAAAVLTASLVVSYASASDAAPPAKKHTATKKAKTPPPPSVQDQIQVLRNELQSQIDGLKNQVSAKDAELKQAQQAAADAQAAADKAAAAASAQQQAVTDNAAAVTTLQTTVNDLKGNQLSLATTVSDETAKIKKDIASPNAIHYKGVNITPGGFVAAETVWRSKATGGDIPTAFTAIPYEGADAYLLSEFFGTARQSRVSMMVEGKPKWGTLRGYYEADWLGTGITSNNNQSNSYVLRQRVIWAQAETNNHWGFTGGQMWSMATEDKKGISNLSGDILTPQTIDPNYVAGFVWTRQYGFRVTKSSEHAAFGIAAENSQQIYTATLAGNTPYAVLGSVGQNGGNYNAAISASATTTYVQNYTNQVVSTPVTTCTYNPISGLTPCTTTYNSSGTFVPVYNTIVANTNITNLTFNQAPDIIAKATFDPGWGHYEIIGIAGFAHESVYPGVTTNSTKYGNIYDIECPSGALTSTGAACAPVVASSSATGANAPRANSIVLGGFAASARVPVIKNKLTIGAKALYGPGMGRYGNSTLADVTADNNGNLAPIHNLSGLLTVEATPTPRLSIYLNYGGDYAGRADFSANPTGIVPTTLGSPTATFCPTGYTPSTASSVCTKSPSAALLAAGGTWGGHWSAPSTYAPVGYGSRYTAVSATCAATANPGYNGSSTGYYPGGTGCGNQTRNIQEITGGWWYDVYKGEHGRFRQGFQYAYAVREGWSGTSSTVPLASPTSFSSPAIGAKGIDNMFWTSLRYYLP